VAYQLIVCSIAVDEMSKRIEVLEASILASNTDDNGPHKEIQ
jgi:hypothetical protein